MFAPIYRVLFLGLMIAIGTQIGYGIYKMRDKMRGLALEKVSEPWPTLKPAPTVDHSVDPYIFKKKRKGQQNPTAQETASYVYQAYKIIVDLKREIER